MSSKRLIDTSTRIILNYQSALSTLFYLFPARLTVQDIIAVEYTKGENLTSTQGSSTPFLNMSHFFQNCFRIRLKEL